MAQAARYRPLTWEARFRCHNRTRGLCGGQSGTVTSFVRNASVFLSPSFHQCSTIIHSFIYHQRRIALVNRQRR